MWLYMIIPLSLPGNKPNDMNLPVDFVTYTRRLLGEDAYTQLEEALQQETPVSVRVNEKKRSSGERTNAVLASSSKVGWCTTGYYLNERPTFTFDPLFHAGCYYVQEASSMFVEQVLRTYVTHPVVMLDLCAAPGGKSTHARSVLPEGSLLVANELIRNRSQVLAENLIKWGHPEVVVTQNEPADFAALSSFFDVILTDVPCSGEGMFRKDKGAIEEWSTENVHNCRNRQRDILSDVWEALKPGGLLIYSTCTYNRYEDEDNVAWLSGHFGAEVLPVPVKPEWNITGNLSENAFPAYHFFPHRTKGEGFFLAALRKPSQEDFSGDEETCRVKAKNKGGKNRAKLLPVPAECKKCLLHADAYRWEINENRITAFPLLHQERYVQLARCLKVIHAGIVVGELKGKDCIPHHSLAMSTELNADSFPHVSLTYEQAIAYLRKETLTLGEEVPRGYVLLTYQHVPIGFAKNIGNRANNLYPQEWRIRSGYLPEEIRCL